MAWLVCMALAFTGVQAPAEYEELAPHASGVCLAKVISVKEVDARGSDGPLYLVLQLERIRDSGFFCSEVHIVTAHGGLSEDDRIPPPPEYPYPLELLRPGRLLWLVFGPHSFDTKIAHDVVNVWPQEAKEADLLEKAVKQDVYRWHPCYDSQTGITFGWSAEPEANRGRLVVEKERKQLYELRLRSAETPHAGIYGSGGRFPSVLPKHGKLLGIRIRERLWGDTEFFLPPGHYNVQRMYDAETGKPLAASVFADLPVSVELLDYDYDPDTGNLVEEVRFDWLRNGGRAAGGKTEHWWRMTVSRFDAKSGELKEQTHSRYDHGWVLVNAK